MVVGESNGSSGPMKLPSKTLDFVGINVESDRFLVKGGVKHRYGVSGGEARELLGIRDGEGRFESVTEKGRITAVFYGRMYGPAQMPLSEYDARGQPEKIVVRSTMEGYVSAA